MNEKDRERLGLSETEAAAMNEAMNEVKQQVFGELRALYVEMTGDPATAEKLSPETIQSEIFAKGPEGARPQARRQLARELAGLAPPPADLAKTPVTERTFPRDDEHRRPLRARGGRAAGRPAGPGPARQGGRLAQQVRDERVRVRLLLHPRRPELRPAL